MSTARQVGKSFKVLMSDWFKDSTRVGHQYVAVYQCSCGEYFIGTTWKSRLGHREGCEKCYRHHYTRVTESRWITTLRERILRLQNQFRDRCGSGRCERCKKHRQGARGSEDRRCRDNLCRECQAVITIEPPPPIMCLETNRLLFDCRFPYKDDASPSFENAVRVLEDYR